MRFRCFRPQGERYVAHILPLSSVLRNGSERSSDAVGALLLRKVTLGGQSYGELIARTFDLTPAELRVFLSIVEVGGVPETLHRARHRRDDGEDASASRVRQDGRFPSGGSRQAARPDSPIHLSTNWLFGVGTVEPFGFLADFMEKPQGINVSDPRAGLLALSMQLTAEHSELIESIYDAGTQS